VPQAYVLLTPWELFDLPKPAVGAGRRPLSLSEPVEVPGGRPLYLAAPAGSSVDVEGQRLGAQRETNEFNLEQHQHCYSLYSLSIGTRDEDATMAIQLDNIVVGRIRIIRGHVPRPSWSLGRDSSAPRDSLQGRLDLYLLGLVDLIRLADDPDVVGHESGWERLSNAWTGREISLSNPPMALIVRHAEKLRRLLDELGRHPRRILSRTRDRTPVDRVQQLDIASVRWLSRQPGRKVYERAGPRQRILAVRRFEDLDTLENRVLRDLAIRSHSLAAAYTEQYLALTNSQRWQRVDRYRRGCRRLARGLRDDGIGKLRPPIVPNYPLLQERRYRRVWRAHREIIRRLDEQDECWRWQHRLWSDFCRLAIQVALHRHPRFRAIAESPLRIAPEQQRGRWSLVDAHSGTYLMHDEQGHPTVVISVLWDTAAEHPKLKPWMASLGAAAVLHLQSLEDGRESYLLLWPLHLFGDDMPDLNWIAASGQRALGKRLSGVDVRAEGLVLVSSIDPPQKTTPPAVRNGAVVAAHLSAGYRGLRQDIDEVGRWLHSMALRLVSKPDADE